MQISEKGIDLITHFEGIKLDAYLDSAKIPTIGYGATFYEDGSKVKLGQKISPKRAKELLAFHLKKFEDVVKSKVKRPLKQNEFDAAVSFAFNAGTGYISGGKRKDYAIWHNIQQDMPDHEISAYWQGLAITAGGRVLPGLVRRRKAESFLYTTGELKYF